MPYKFTAEEIEAEIREMQKELTKRFVRPFVPHDRELILVEHVAELRLRIARLEQWIGNL